MRRGDSEEGGKERFQQDEDWIRSRNSDYQIKHGSNVR